MNFDFVIILPVTYLITRLTNVEEYVKGLPPSNMSLVTYCLYYLIWAQYTQYPESICTYYLAYFTYADRYANIPY
jgi:hypothetical protein